MSGSCLSTPRLLLLPLRRGTGSRKRHSLDFLDHENLDHVTFLDIVVVNKTDATLEALLHLGDVLLESAQAPQLSFVDDDVVTKEPRISGANDFPLGDVASRNGTDFRNAEHFANLGPAQRGLLERGL